MAAGYIRIQANDTYIIAEKENISPSYVSRTLRLNLLIPDIVKAITEGKQPRDLML